MGQDLCVGMRIIIGTKVKGFGTWIKGAMTEYNNSALVKPAKRKRRFSLCGEMPEVD